MQSMRVQIPTADSPHFPWRSSWVKALISFSVLISKLDHLPEETYLLLGTVWKSVQVHFQWGVQLQNGVPACSMLCWRASFVSALLQMKSQREITALSLPSLLVLHPLAHGGVKPASSEPPTGTTSSEQAKTQQLRQRQQIPGGRLKNKVCDSVAALSVVLVPPLSPH